MGEPQYRLEGIVHTKSDVLEDFEGPLDVIFELLSKNKIEIQDIQISAILEQYLAYLDAALFAVDVVRSLLAGNWGGALLPVIALLNFAVFIWPEVHYLANRTRQQYSPRTVQFKQAVKQQEKEKGYHHKCAVCGRTDTDYPDLQFRYCSKCAGYRCFCQDHIFSHVHFTEEDQ